MATNLENVARIDGTINNVPTWATGLVTVQLGEITITKTASPMVWINGELTYTITITNSDADYPFADLVLTDQLDPSITLVPGSVMVNSAAHTDYTFSGNLLTITDIPEIAEDGGTAVISFRVTKV